MFIVSHGNRSGRSNSTRWESCSCEKDYEKPIKVGVMMTWNTGANGTATFREGERETESERITTLPSRRQRCSTETEQRWRPAQVYNVFGSTTYKRAKLEQGGKACEEGGDRRAGSDNHAVDGFNSPSTALAARRIAACTSALLRTRCARGECCHGI